jgi:uncharacterized protein (DUF1800 family)
VIRKFLLMFLAILLQHQVSYADGNNNWRLGSRFGYAPTPDQMDQNDDVKGRARLLLEEAYSASHVEPEIPEGMSILKTSLPDAFAKWKEQRESKTTIEEGKQKQFTRDMSRTAMAWRLYQCSRIESEKPLVAKMTEFWFNHLNVYTFKGSVQPFIGDYLVNVIRPNVLGHFDDLLIASFKHPAMLFYLDQWLNSYVELPPGVNRPKLQTRGINENYARELLELHTMGVNSGYTQADVQNLARILSGWTVSQTNPSGSQFVDRFHDHSDKILLGHTFTNQGEDEAEKALRFLAAQPQTAHRVALRLAQWFVSDHPSEKLVNAMTKTYLTTRGDILEVMRTLVESDETWDTKSELIKTPIDFVCSTLVIAGGPRDLKDYTNALSFLSNLGQPMNAWKTPDGYSTSAEQWISAEALSRRADFAFLIGSRIDRPANMINWISPQSRSIIEQELPKTQASFIMASPDFIRK